MMDRIHRTFELARASVHLLFEDLELMWLTVLSIILSSVAFFAIAVIPLGLMSDEPSIEGAGQIMVAIAGLIAVSITTYFNGAVVAGVFERLDGGDPTVGSALRSASAVGHLLVGWAIIGTIIITTIRIIAERVPVIGGLLSAIADGVWSVVTFLAVPAIVAEQIGPMAALKRSAQLFKTTWGANLAGNFGFGLVGMLLFIPVMAVAALLYMALPPLGIVVGIIGVSLIFVGMSTLGSVFQAVLYRHATGRSVHPEFDRTVLQEAFGPRQPRGGYFLR